MELQVLYYLFYAIFSQNALLSQILLYGPMPVLGGIIIIIYAYLTFKSSEFR